MARRAPALSTLAVLAIALAPMSPGVTTTLLPEPSTTAPAPTTTETPTTVTPTSTTAPAPPPTPEPTQPPQSSIVTRAAPTTSAPTTTIYVIPGVTALTPTSSVAATSTPHQNADLPGWMSVAFSIGIGGMALMLLGRRLLTAVVRRRSPQ
jgi:hypothetical protein